MVSVKLERCNRTFEQGIITSNVVRVLLFVLDVCSKQLRTVIFICKKGRVRKWLCLLFTYKYRFDGVLDTCYVSQVFEPP
jgi:hypothetical protein